MNIPIRKLRGAVLVIAGLIPPATLQWRGAIQMAYQSQDTPKAKLAFWGMNCVLVLSALMVIFGSYLLFNRAKDRKSENRRQGEPS